MIEIINIDILIFVVFLALNLIIGLRHGKNTKNISDYAIGTRNFSTAELVTTIVATRIGGGVLANRLSVTYTEGIRYVLITTIAITLSYIITGILLGSRIQKFLGALSIAEIMGNIYGKSVRIIVAAVSIISMIGYIAIQLKILSIVVSTIFGIEPHICMMACLIIVTFYSAFGGIRSVSFTDLLQFCTFTIIIPIIALAIWKNVYNVEQVTDIIQTDPLYDLSLVFDYKDTSSWYLIGLFLFFIVPSVRSEESQRLLMARDSKQATKAFIIAGLLIGMIFILISIIGFLLYCIDQNIESTRILEYVVNNFSYPGFKGLVVICVTAMIMSTADSIMNSASTLFSHDIIGVLFPNIENKKLPISRGFVILLGIVSYIIALRIQPIFQIVLDVQIFFMPVVTIPLIYTIILNNRTSTKGILISMFVGFCTAIVWKYNFQESTRFEPIIPGLVANAATLYIVHNLYKNSINSKQNNG